MWCLSGGVFTVAISVWFQERKADTSLIAMATGLPFALPSVRNSQPGIPVVAGTTSDMIGFFFNVVLVAARWVFIRICRPVGLIYLAAVRSPLLSTTSSRIDGYMALISI